MNLDKTFCKIQSERLCKSIFFRSMHNSSRSARAQKKKKKVGEKVRRKEFSIPRRGKVRGVGNKTVYDQSCLGLEDGFSRKCISPR